jgi:bifunctional non-homologous end joining protein LigD
MEQIAHQEDHVWNSKETAGTGQAWYRQDSPATAAANGTQAGATDSEQLRIAPRRSAKASAQIAPPVPRSVVEEPKSTAPHFADLDELPQEPQPEFIQPQLAQETEAPPEGSGWLHELKLASRC